MRLSNMQKNHQMKDEKHIEESYPPYDPQISDAFNRLWRIAVKNNNESAMYFLDLARIELEIDQSGSNATRPPGCLSNLPANSSSNKPI